MRTYLILFLLLLSYFGVLAQSDNESNAVTSGQQWYEFNCSQAFKKVVLQADFQLSTSNDPDHTLNINKHLTQYGVRGWGHYYLTPRIKLSAALGYWHNFEIGEIKQSASRELRPTFQFQYFFVKRKFTIYNRLRLETRFVDPVNAKGIDYSTRVRYMPKFIYTINSNVIRRKSLYLICFDEVFMTLNRHDIIDRNRMNLGLGYCFTDDVILEVVYTNQQSYLNQSKTEITNALGLTLSINNIGKYLRKN
jgi:hypothetical protein